MRFARLVALVSFALSLLAAPLPTEAQQAGKPPRLGLLYDSTSAFAPESDFIDRAIAEGLRDGGCMVGQNLAVEFRSALGRPDCYPALAAELVRLGVDVIVTGTNRASGAARGASRTIPIVMAGASIDPVAAGFVASLGRPCGNITGVTLGDLPLPGENDPARWEGLRQRGAASDWRGGDPRGPSLRDASSWQTSS